jgi:serine/threonine protein kinase
MSNDKATATAPDPYIGKVVLGRYRLVRRLARGGMGDVYIGRNEGAAGFKRPVVVKRAHRSAMKQAHDLFAREARILSRLRHPSIVGILDFAEQDGEYLMALDYVHGYTLKQWGRFVSKTRGPFPAWIAVHAVLEIIDALEYAHSLEDKPGVPLDIVHRDIKPSNILIDIDGRVMLADFGIARATTDATDVNTDSALKGTLAYMAPELFSYDPPSRVTDVYSAAVTLRELLVGRNELMAEDAMITTARVLGQNLAPLRDKRPDVSPSLADAIARGMSRHPDGRYQTAAELAAALRDAVWDAPSNRDAAFATAVKSDFAGTALAEHYNIDSLAVRWRAWSEGTSERILPLDPNDLMATVTIARPSDPTSGVHEQPTQLLPDAPAPVEETEPTPKTARGGSITWIAATAAVIAIAGAFAWVKLSGGDPPTELIVVEGDVARDGDGAGPTSLAEPGATGVSAGFSAAFNAKSRQLAQCMQRHAADLGALDAVSVRLEIAADGAVTSAGMLPEALNGTRLESCVRELARAVRFEPQPEPVTVTIPLTVRATGRAAARPDR